MQCSKSEVRGRDASYLAPPAQIRTCGFSRMRFPPRVSTAVGCRRRANVLCHAYPARRPIPHPMQSLCTLRNAIATGHATLATKRTLLLTWGGLSPAGSHQLCGWRTYSITSSARPSSVGGISRPSALAVLRLITSSKWVGCSTGRSAGRAPFRILSTYTAALRKSSSYFAE
jgi:hypothetical protein